MRLLKSKNKENSYFMVFLIDSLEALYRMAKRFEYSVRGRRGSRLTSKRLQGVFHEFATPGHPIPATSRRCVGRVVGVFARKRGLAVDEHVRAEAKSGRILRGRDPRRRSRFRNPWRALR